MANKDLNLVVSETTCLILSMGTLHLQGMKDIAIHT